MCLVHEEQTKVDDVFVLIEYLSKEHDPETAEDNLEIRNQVINLIIGNWKGFCKRPKRNAKLLRSAAEFLIKSIKMSNIGKFVDFIEDKMKRHSFLTGDSKPTNSFEEILLNLQKAAFDFLYQNYEELKKYTCSRLNNVLFTHFVSYILQVSTPKPKEDKVEVVAPQEEAQKKTKKKLKRGEPKNSDGNEEKPKLKKTKKTKDESPKLIKEL